MPIEANKHFAVVLNDEHLPPEVRCWIERFSRRPRIYQALWLAWCAIAWWVKRRYERLTCPTLRYWRQTDPLGYKVEQWLCGDYKARSEDELYEIAEEFVRRYPDHPVHHGCAASDGESFCSSSSWRSAPSFRSSSCS